MIIYGKNVIKEAIFAKRKIYQIWIDEKMNDSSFIYFLKDKNQTFDWVSKDKLNQMSNQQLHQGVVADVEPYRYYELEDLIKDKHQRFLILDSIEDPHNLGAILRTAEAVGLDGIIMSKKGQVQLNATVAKVSTGAIEHVPVCLVTNLNAAILYLKSKDIWVIGTDGQSEMSYHQIPKNRSLAIVMGNEGEGIRPLVKKNCDMLVHIPMKGKINSLNVSVAAALMMYETMI
jgi:23S rRNA (guanosine2251-2'-O)-methyltransferase